MKKILFLFSLVFSLNTLAIGFVCSEDMRDRDGVYREVRLVDAGNEKFDLVYYSMKGSEPLVNMTQLAAGLTCNMANDKRIANCFGVANFMMTTKKVEMTQMKGSEAGVTTKNTYFYMNLFNKDGKEGAKEEHRFLFSDCKVM
jgi:hypothetical protein